MPSVMHLLAGDSVRHRLDARFAPFGSTVLVEDLDSGSVSQYRLASAHHSLGPDAISAGSPIGRALIGATAETVVTVDLPNGRSRSMRLAHVTSDGVADPRARAAA